MPKSDENQDWDGSGPTRLTPDRAKYRYPTSAEDGTCAACHWFRGKGKPCALVEVAVQPDMTCRLFSPQDFYVTKADPERQMVFGWASVAVDKAGRQVTDRHGDQIPLDDLEDAAYDYVLKYGTEAMGDMHRGEAKGRLVESVVFTPEKLQAMGLAKGAVPGGWWVGFKVDDPGLWAEYRKGNRPMFSIQGVAMPEAISE